MKRNYIPEGMSSTPAQITERNSWVTALSTDLSPETYTLFKATVHYLTATESADALAEEANDILRDLLEELGDEAELDAELRQLGCQLSQQLQTADASDEPLNDEPWLQARGHDLAHTVAAFWTDLADTYSGRQAACQRLLEDFADDSHSSRRHALELACSRFYLDTHQAHRLLARAHELAQQRHQGRAAASVNQQSQRAARQAFSARSAGLAHHGNR